MKTEEEIKNMIEKLKKDLIVEKTQRLKNQITGNIDALKWVLS